MVKKVIADGMKILKPLRAIRAKCLDCVCWQANEVRACENKRCPLWPYRMGAHPQGGEISKLSEVLETLKNGSVNSSENST